MVHRAAMLMAAWVCVLSGCAGDGPLLVGTAERAQLVADWNDIDAAVEVGAGQNEMAVVSTESPSEDERVFELRTAGAEPGRVVARRSGVMQASGAKSVGPQAIDLQAQVGRFGDSKREKRLIASIRKRLGDLTGVDWAPIDD